MSAENSNKLLVRVWSNLKYYHEICHNKDHKIETIFITLAEHHKQFDMK